jgi:hypothetical protein|tara:strand:+ start:161 stop:1645 length:1485 start_codon:yes stop_codon:yes gene_type:complete
MGSDNPDQLDFAGDYNLSGIVVINHAGEGTNIQHMVLEMNIYEGIDKSSVTGTLVVTDATNLIGNLPLQGTERLIFKLSTPGTDHSEDIIDASELTGHPFYIYRVSNRNQLSQGVLSYIIHFGSREFVRNLRVKVSKSYEGSIDTIVKQILSDKEGLDTRKNVYFEATKNSDKVVIPNLSPFGAINLLKDRALPNNGNGAGYFFYETTKGFYFRSWGDMCTQNHYHPREAIQKFHYSPQNISDDKLNDNPNPEKKDVQDKVLHDLQSVESYKVVNQFHDTAAQTALGTYGHRVITHNLYDKSFSKTDFHYHNEFDEFVHTDFTFNESSAGKYAVVNTPVDFDNKSVSDYAESRVSLMPTSQFVYGEETGTYGTNVSDDGKFEGYRIATNNAINAGTTIELTVKGQTYIQPGHIILFDLRPVEEKGVTNDNKPYDRQYSGRYIVRSIRHRVSKTDYKMVLVIVKDSVREPFPLADKRFTGESFREGPEFIHTTRI